MKINIKTIPHDQQPYDTVGDWRLDADGILQIRVSDMNNPPFELAVALHEIIEAALCLADNIPELLVDRFDQSWVGEGEPGDNFAAPYHEQHVTAAICERAIAQALGIDWNKYTKAVDAL